MGKLTELEQWEDDVYQIETSDPVLGGPDGVSNRPQKQLANRTQWLKKQIEQANNDLADHIRSRNHPDATLTDKGFVRLYSGVTSLDETMAATPKAVKIAMDNANERLAKARNLSDLQSVPQALQALTIATTKKAVEDTQIGLDRQPVMLISTADDLSNLPAGARRFARNNTGVTVLPTGNNCYIEVVAKRDSQNGGCVKVVDHDNPGNAWTGIRNNVPADAGFTWVQQYNESHRPPQQEMPDMPDALIRGNNLSDLTDPPKAVEYLGLTEAVKRASNAVQKNGDTMSAPLVNTHPDAFRLKQPGRSFFWRFDGANLYLLRTAINDPDGGWDAARPLYVNADSGQVYLGPDTRINGTLYVGDARVHTNGNTYGIAWGGWLSDYLNIQFDARATTVWVNQYFATKNTGSLAQTGWFKDSSTGLIIQWGEVGRTGYGTWVNFPISFTSFCSAVFLTLSDSPVSLSNSTQNIHANSRTVSGFNYAANTAESSAFWLAIGR
ncbi:hypothetical protein XS16_005119 [Salmonella enterica subsp. enterica serovar Newport]|nr:hypothetical protein [Salmonella enterica subsp. enterica serovar Newport]